MCAMHLGGSIRECASRDLVKKAATDKPFSLTFEDVPSVNPQDVHTTHWDLRGMRLMHTRLRRHERGQWEEQRLISEEEK